MHYLNRDANQFEIRDEQGYRIALITGDGYRGKGTYENRARLISKSPEMVDLLRDRARGYCPHCGCDVCNTAGCDSCRWMRQTRRFLAELDGETYIEPPILPADEINKRNMKLAHANQG